LNISKRDVVKQTTKCFVTHTLMQRGPDMTNFKTMIAALAFTGLAASTQPAAAVVYCTYIGYPAACVVRPGVRLVARPVGVGVVGPHVGHHHGNLNGGVNRVGRRR
jgi:hypothetical protein